jgi:ribosomal protein S18 acetylase RimI-like enzyme
VTDALHIRPARLEDAPALARLQVDSYRSAYAGILPQDFLDQFTYDDQERDWSEMLSPAARDVILAAEGGDSRLRGYAVARAPASFPPPYDCELLSLHVRQDVHRRGIGRALVSATAEALTARGLRALMLWVLEANPARGFYERLGAVQLDGRKPMINAHEVAYGWPDLRSIPAPGRAAVEPRAGR